LMEQWRAQVVLEAQELVKQQLEEAVREKQSRAEAERRIDMCERVECALLVCVSEELYGSEAAFTRLENSVLERESASAMFLQAQVLCCCCCCCCCCCYGPDL